MKRKSRETRVRRPLADFQIKQPHELETGNHFYGQTVSVKQARAEKSMTGVKTIWDSGEQGEFIGYQTRLFGATLPDLKPEKLCKVRFRRGIGFLHEDELNWH